MSQQAARENEMLVALSFLGTSDYQQTTYLLPDGTTCQTRFFPEVLGRLYPRARLLVVMTEQAKAGNGQALATHCPYDSIDIPIGHTEAEIWQIFNAIADRIPEQSRLVVDITHGFRSQPLLALAACLYVRTVKDVVIKRILYGAYEARDLASNRSPVFDLTSFLTLIDWSSATDDFLRYGHAAPLRDQLQAAGVQGSMLGQVAQETARLTQALAVVRPQRALQRSTRLKTLLDRLRPVLQVRDRTAPFARLLSRIEQRFAPLAASEEHLFTRDGFMAQAEMIRYYLDTEQYVQAVTLAREALVSKVCTLRGLNPLNERKKAEMLLNTLSRTGKPMTARGLPAGLAQLWRNIRNVRNDVNHAGMRPGSRKTQTVLKDIQTYCEATNRFLTA